MSLDQDVIAELETIVDTKYVRTAAVIWSPSSGMTSRRQSRTFFPRADSATAVAESKTTAPTAAQGAGPVYALDAVELDVAGRRGAGDPGERAVRAQPREGGRHVVDDVLGAHQADACVGHQRVRTPPAQRAALQNDRAGLGHADHASGEHGIDRSKSATDSGASRSSGTRVTPELGRPAIRQPGRNRPGRVPPIPRDGGALRPIERPWAGACRFSAASPAPRWDMPSAGFEVTRHQRGFTHVQPSRPSPSPVGTGWNGPLGLDHLSFAPRRYQQRTSGWGQTTSTSYS